MQQHSCEFAILYMLYYFLLHCRAYSKFEVMYAFDHFYISIMYSTKLKKQISTRENVAVAFADAAAEHSSCPSGRKG